jgi:hypothetical protein
MIRESFVSPWWDREISIIRSARSSDPKTISIIDAVNIHSPKSNLEEFNDQELRQRKVDNYAILPHGEFRNSRRAADLHQFSGLVQLDFDHVVSPEGLKAILSKIPWICFASVSISGRGVWALALTNAEHSEALARCLAEEAEVLTAQEVDTKNSISAAALRFLSCDDSPVWNVAPLPFPRKF